MKKYRITFGLALGLIALLGGLLARAAGPITASGLYSPLGIAIDRSVVPNRIYIADSGNSRVLGWHSVAALSNGAAADLVIGESDFGSGYGCSTAPSSTSLCAPSALAVDSAGNLYVGEGSLVLEYNSPFTTDVVPDMVFGQNGSFTSNVAIWVEALPTRRCA
jgi:hypothetical protein